MKYLQGLNTVFSGRRKLVSIVYVIQLIIAIPLAWVTYDLLGKALGNSLSAGRLIGDFDYTIWRDMLNRNSDDLGVFWTCLAVLLPVSLLIMSTVSGGIYHCLQKSDSDFKIFTKGVRMYWWRYLVISLAALVLVVLWSVLVWKWYVNDLFTFLEYWEDERQIAWLALFLFFIWTLGIYFIFIWSNLAKVDQLKLLKNPFGALHSQFKPAIRSYFSLGKPLILIVLIGFLITVFYLAVSSTLKPSAVIMLLVLQQLVSWLKIGLRIAAYEEVRVLSYSSSSNGF